MFWILQSACLIVVTAGIYVEAHYGAHFGFALITVGSLAFAVSTKLRKIRLEKEIGQLRRELRTHRKGR